MNDREGISSLLIDIVILLNTITIVLRKFFISTFVLNLVMLYLLFLKIFLNVIPS